MAWILKFSHPWVLCSLLVLIFVAALLHWRMQRVVLYRYPLATEFYRQGLVTRLPRRKIIAVLRWLLLFTLVLLLGKLQLVDPRSCREVEGIDIILALDVSGSMTLPHDQQDR